MKSFFFFECDLRKNAGKIKDVQVQIVLTILKDQFKKVLLKICNLQILYLKIKRIS